MTDHGLLQICLGHSELGLSIPGCEAVDLDCDQDVDDQDLGILLGCMSGANVPVDPSCLD